MTEDDETRQSAAKQIRNVKIMAEAASGKSVTDIAKSAGLSRQTVSGILNSDEMRLMAKQFETRAFEMVNDAFDTVHRTIQYGEEANALKASLELLKGVGVLKHRVEGNVKHEHEAKSLDDQALMAEARRALEFLERARAEKAAAIDVTPTDGEEGEDEG